MPPAPYDQCIPREPPSRDIRVPTGQLAAIIAEVAHKHRISVIEIKSRRHEHRIVLARHEAFWRCRNETFFSLPQIGRAFGGFDHTTVLNGCRQHEKRMKEAEHG
jgi:chromosomal replication initiator protein